jgi:type IV pilus assembly protein PilQ
VLGYLFRSASKTRDRTELLIFITPRVVSDSLAEK